MSKPKRSASKTHDAHGNTYLVAIIFFLCKDPLKYRHNIKNTSHYLRMFKRFALKKEGALYINYYHKHLAGKAAYSHREYLKDWNNELKQWI